MNPLLITGPSSIIFILRPLYTRKWFGGRDSQGNSARVLHQWPRPGASISKNAQTGLSSPLWTSFPWSPAALLLESIRGRRKTHRQALQLALGLPQSKQWVWRQYFFGGHEAVVDGSERAELNYGESRLNSGRAGWRCDEQNPLDGI